MDKIKHLENKYSVARYDLIRECEGNEMRFYLYLKLYAINKHEAFPTYSTIKGDLGWDNKKITRIIKMMIKKERLKIGKLERKIKGIKQVVNIYDITWYDNVNNKGISSGKKQEGSGKLELPLRGGGSGKLELKQVANNITRRNFSSSKKKPYFRGDEMRKAQGKWWVLPKDGSAWLEFAGQEKEIIWK